MLWLVSQEDHVGNPIRQVVELTDHAADILDALALLPLVRRQADMSDKIPQTDRREHDPVDPGQLLGNVFLTNGHEQAPLNLRQTHARNGD